MYKNHQEACKKLSCSCKRIYIGQTIKSKASPEAKFNMEYVYRGEPKEVFDQKYETIVKKSNIKFVVGYLELQFENYIESHGTVHDCIDFCYMRFLILYSGKIAKTYQLLNRKIHQLH